ncbi:hypothetical protein [Echinimonas agarilytica]|uniref:Transmembrane protein n=1 Tax=Echinimonas agarilytica TaxID=1215918 RepID=A0AA42B6W6_9GAMM|nr:hypothetical protein [Echinimonas agarilytica]MCM2679207.1 hypothetical protein [Echinimonas agarilytica]
MKIPRNDRLVFGAAAVGVLIYMIAVFIQHQILEQSIENCRYYADGRIESYLHCDRHDRSCFELGSDNIAVPPDFMALYMKGRGERQAYVQKYYRWYLQCLESHD